MSCKWLHNGTDCMLGHFDGSPDHEDCQTCSSYQGRSRGAGDVVARASKLVRIKPCQGCKKRQTLLNRLIPFRKKPNA